MKKHMTLEDHLANAKDIRQAYEAIGNALIFTGNKFGKSHKAAKSLERALKHINTAKCLLDDEWHMLITDEEYMEHGHIYYSNPK